jgi:hypothetical protein
VTSPPGGSPTDPPAGPTAGHPGAARLVIGVIGAQDAGADALRDAYAIGGAIAALGHITLTGGRGGVMAEASRGAHEAGGLVLAILPGDDLHDANAYIDIPVLTGLGHARNAIVARTANALIAVGGRYGTLSEIAFGLIADTPVIGLRTWELRDGEGAAAPVIPATSPRDAVDLAVRMARVSSRVEGEPGRPGKSG